MKLEQTWKRYRAISKESEREFCSTPSVRLKAASQRHGKKLRLVLVGFGLFFYLTGCETPYYWHLINGQTCILLGRQPINELLTDPNLEPDTRQKFEFLQAVLVFARDDIGLATSSNYTYYFDTKGEPVGWNTSASPPDRFEPFLWKFPVVGKLPYKGFFDIEFGRRERDHLQAQGLDAILTPISAYSTLGFFSDPVFSPMLDYPEDGLANLILHELTHATIYAEGHTDYNESLATFVGESGSLDFLAEYFGPNTKLIENVRRRRDTEARFSSFLNRVITSLDSLYKLGLPKDSVLTKREEIFSHAKEIYKSMKDEVLDGNFDGFLQWKVNNARLLSYRRYHGKREVFEKIHSLKNENLSEALQVFKACAKEQNPWTCLQDSTIVHSGEPTVMDLTSTN